MVAVYNPLEVTVVTKAVNKANGMNRTAVITAHQLPGIKQARKYGRVNKINWTVVSKSFGTQEKLSC